MATMSTDALVTADSFRVNTFGTPDASHAFVVLLANGATIACEARRGLTRVWHPEHNLNGRQVN